MEDNVAKDAMADLSMKLLLMRVIQLQNLNYTNNFQLSNSNLTPAIHYLNTHLTERIYIDVLAKKCHRSKTLFFTTLKEQFGTTPINHLLHLRVEDAKKIKADPTLTISEVCYQSGFNSVNYFIKAFKRLVRVTPKRYKTV